MDLTAREFEKRLKSVGSVERAADSMRYFKTGKGEYGEGDVFIGVRMGPVSALAKEFRQLELDEVEKLLDSPIHEVRIGALTIMALGGRSAKTSEARRKELFDLYIRKRDRINNWDLVDCSAQWVVGRYLYDKDRSLLYTLAHSTSLWDRRISIISTGYFIRQGDYTDTLRISEILIQDKEDLIHKASGWMLREVGGKELIGFLDAHATVMPRTMLRYAIEKLDTKQREYYMGLKTRLLRSSNGTN